MKKEYLILIALILLLGAYLLFNKDNTDNTILPQIIKLTPDKITGLEITKKDGTIELERKDKQWFIKGKDHLADSVAVGNILDALKGFKLSALVSEKADLRRYELDDEKKIFVKVREGSTPVFEFTMGKTAPTHNHTFVMLEKSNTVYHANGSFRTYFEKSEQALRDKKVLAFKEKSIKQFMITKEGVSKTFFAKEEKKDDKDPLVFWVAKDGSTVDKQAVSNLLSALSFLECDSFLDEKGTAELKTKAMAYQIELENDKKMTVSIEKSLDQENFTGISSMNADGFVLSAFNGKEITTSVDTLLGIKKENAEEKKVSPTLKLVYQPYKWIVVIPAVFIFTMILGLLCILTGLIFKSDAANIIAVIWSRLCCAIVPINVAIVGKKNYKRNQSYIIVANHQSMADIPVAHGFLGLNIKWIMKKELGEIPIFGAACHRLGCIYVDRKNPGAAIASIQTAKKNLSRKASVLFFAEGTRSRDGKVMPFKKGAFRFAYETGLPILPITIKNSNRILPPDSLDITPGQIDIIVHPPIHILESKWTAIEETLAATRKTISNAL